MDDGQAASAAAEADDAALLLASVGQAGAGSAPDYASDPGDGDSMGDGGSASDDDLDEDEDAEDEDAEDEDEGEVGGGGGGLFALQLTPHPRAPPSPLSHPRLGLVPRSYSAC